MHETKLVTNIIEEARKQGEVKSILIEVGELAPIKPEHLKTHLAEIVDWHVEVKQVPGVVKCECGYHGKPDIMNRGHDFVLFTCPWCGDVPEIESGNQIKIKEVKCA
ncbi:hydrogenase maturation nickel metallochaperone HypA [Candidatus Woesearchaeota archaeon]|nr:hydrogenase maturation nickel metallochaperone HypA [Candidatus Woesearchaeota archaeon]